MSPEKHRELLEQYREGNEQALNELVTGLDKDLRKKIKYNIHKIEVNHAPTCDINDIVQETWIRFIKYQDKCDLSVSGFVMTCAYYAVLDYKVKVGDRREQSIECEGMSTDAHLDHIIEEWDDVEASLNWHEPSPEEAYLKAEGLNEKLDDVFATSGSLERDVYTLHHAYGYTYKEIASDLDLTYREVSVMLDNTGKKIQRRIKKCEIRLEV